MPSGHSPLGAPTPSPTSTAIESAAGAAAAAAEAAAAKIATARKRAEVRVMLECTRLAVLGRRVLVCACCVRGARATQFEEGSNHEEMCHLENSKVQEGFKSFMSPTLEL
jgi:hypothetical protein